jgi:NAD(P)-dependent dehydrogenase (short-subunit alcohol dehydrogenase family)
MLILSTGANKGIGFEVAPQLAASGCTVLVGARNKARGDEAAAKLKSEGGEVGHLDILPQQCRHRRAGGRPAFV